MLTHDFIEVITDTEGVFDTVIDTTISGKQFSGSGTMFDSGSARVETVNGRFYGDSAEEIGGTYIFSEPIPDENTATYIGAFGAVSTPQQGDGSAKEFTRIQQFILLCHAEQGEDRH